jgi:hypothetical protein
MVLPETARGFISANKCQLRVTALKQYTTASYHTSLRSLYIYNNPIKALTGPEGSRRLRLPDFETIGT